MSTNGMDHYAIHAAGIQAVQDEQGTACPQFGWNSKNWKALPGGARRRKALSEGGFSIDADLSIVCLVAQFATTAPAQRELMLNTRLTFQGQLYRIDSITIDAGGKMLRIECNDFHQAG